MTTSNNSRGFPRLKPIGIFLALFSLGCVSIAHIILKYRGPGYSGPLIILDNLYITLVVLVFLFILANLGNYFMTLCGLSCDQPLEAFLFSIAIGGSLVSVAILFCGMLHGFHPVILFLLLFLSLLISRKHLANTFLLFSESIACLKENASRGSLIIFGVVASFLIIRALSPPSDWDTLMYHLRLPAQFLQKGAIYLPEDNMYAAIAGPAHMWYVPLFAFAGQAGPGLLSSFLTLALWLAAFAFCLRFLDKKIANLTLACFWGSSVILLVGITPRVDVTLAFFLFLSQFALIKAIYDPAGLKFFYLSAFLLGSAIGIKYNAIIFLVALAPLVIWKALSGFNGFTKAVKPLLWFGLIVAITALPWLMKNYVLFQSPLYPFFTGRQLEPWLSHFPVNPVLGIEVKNKIAAGLAHIAKHFNLFDYVVAPGRLMVEPEGRFYTFNFIFLLLPFLVFYYKEKAINLLILPGILYMVMVIIFWPFSNLRYLIPAIAPLTIACCYIINELISKLSRYSKVYYIIVVFISLMPMAISQSMIYFPYNKISLKYFIGLSSQQNYLQSIPGLRAWAHMVAYVNNHLSPEDKLVLILDGRGFYFQVPVIQDNDLSNWPLLSDAGVSQNLLSSAGISYILVNGECLWFYKNRGMDPKILRWPEFKLFSENCLNIVHREGKFTLYALKNKSPAASH